MPRTRCVALVVCLVSLAGATSVAFKLDYHETITREALRVVGGISFIPQPKDAAQLQARFTDIAIIEIVLANKATDLEDCNEPKSELVVAKPCTDLGETIEGVLRVLKGIEEEHFDGEKIQGGSDRVFDARIRMRDQIRSAQFVGARRTLGRALHAIQDFYAHTNWINVAPTDVRWSGFERRIGQRRGAFGAGTGSPRLARLNEPQCLEGEALITELPQDIKDQLVDRYVKAANEGRNTGLISAQTIRDVIAETPLTSGYYYDPRSDDLSKGGVLKDRLEIIDTGKCRHGWSLLDAVSHAGINKDEPGRMGYVEARAAALRHSTRFVLDVLEEPSLKQGLTDAEHTSNIFGFLGHERVSRLSGVRVLQAPGAPPTQTMWDGVFDVGIVQIWKMHPDIVTCVGPEGGRMVCSDECPDFDWQNETKQCWTALGPQGVAVPNTGRLRVQAWDIDVTTRQLMADGMIDASNPCVRFSDVPCEIPMERGLFVLTFEAPRFTALREGAPGTPPPSLGAGGAPPAARVPPSAAAIDDALGLRDGDNCTGADQFMPQGTAFARSAVAQQLGPDQSNRLYQAVAFAMSVTDQTTKQAVMSAIQSKVSDDAYYGAMTLVAGDLQQSRSVFAGYQSVAGALVGKVTSQGLDRLLPQPKTAAALVPDVDRWILKRLATPALVADAVNMMFGGPQTISAECALNQLAKDGFTDTINGR